MHRKQVSDEGLYLSRKHGGKAMKSTKDVYEDTKIWERKEREENKNVTESLSVYKIDAMFGKDENEKNDRNVEKLGRH